MNVVLNRTVVVDSDLVVRRSLPASSTVRRVPVWLVLESFLQEELSVKVGPRKQNKKQVSMLAKQSKTKMYQEITLWTDGR